MIMGAGSCSLFFFVFTNMVRVVDCICEEEVAMDKDELIKWLLEQLKIKDEQIGRLNEIIKAEQELLRMEQELTKLLYRDIQ